MKGAACKRQELACTNTTIIEPPALGKTQASSGLMFSSMAMSLNSLDSKTSPHSWHSTNSASSSRATTRTRGCLQDFSIGIGSGGRFEIDGFWVEFIFGPRRISARACSRIGGILSLSGRMSSACGRQEVPYSRKWMIKAAYGVAAKAWDKCPQSGPFPPLPASPRKEHGWPFRLGPRPLHSQMCFAL
jgi:hypothetical protein